MMLACVSPLHASTQHPMHVQAHRLQLHQGQLVLLVLLVLLLLARRAPACLLFTSGWALVVLPGCRLSLGLAASAAGACQACKALGLKKSWSSHLQCQSVKYTTFPQSPQPGSQCLPAHQPAFTASQPAALSPAKCRAQFTRHATASHAHRQASCMPASTCAVTTLARDRRASGPPHRQLMQLPSWMSYMLWLLFRSTDDEHTAASLNQCHTGASSAAAPQQL
jgi:hypothetical protein